MVFSSDSEFDDDDNFMDDDSEFDDGSGEESESDYEEFEAKAKKSKKKSPAAAKKAPTPKPKAKAKAAPKKKTLRKRGAPAAAAATTAAPKAPPPSPMNAPPPTRKPLAPVQPTSSSSSSNSSSSAAAGDSASAAAPPAAPGAKKAAARGGGNGKAKAAAAAKSSTPARSRKRKAPAAPSSSSAAAATSASSSSSSSSSKPPAKKKPKGKIPEAEDALYVRSHADVARGPPPSKAQPKKPKGGKISDAEARKILTDYMVKQNRPYNSLSVFENLHGAVPKTQAAKAMDALAESGILVRKMFKKVKIYHPPQEQYGDIDDAELAKIEEETKSTQSELNGVSTDNHSLTTDCSRLESLPTNAEADAKIAALENELQAKTAELERLTGGAKLISDDDFTVAREKFEHAHNSWKKRRSIAQRMVEAFLGTESEKTPKQLFKELECEMDEDNDVSVKEFAEFRSTMQGGDGGKKGRPGAGRRVSMHRR